MSNPIPTGEKPIREMTDRELAEETLYWLRTAGRALEAIQNGGMGALLKGMLPGGGKRA